MMKRVAATIDVSDVLGAAGATLILVAAFGLNFLLGLFVLGVGLIVAAVVIVQTTPPTEPTPTVTSSDDEPVIPHPPGA